MDQMPICQREEEGDSGDAVSLFEHLITITCYGCHRVSLHIYVQTRGCTRRWVSVPSLKLAHFPGRFVGGKPMGPADSEAWPWPYTAQAALRLGREPTAAMSAHIPHCCLLL